jgi:Ni,Fe-hydrogenase III component G
MSAEPERAAAADRPPGTRDEALAAIDAAMGDRIRGRYRHSPTRVYLDVSPEDVPAISRLVFRGLGARFQIASGVDTEDAIEILYHWALDRLGLVVTVRTRLPRENPEIESLAPSCKAAEWIEREMQELLGIRFLGHPDPRHLLLRDDWPAGNFPLRRDAPSRNGEGP